jgi:plasmid stabilization system protein ParE
MIPYVLAPAAQRDLRALQIYMAQENIQAARRVLADVSSSAPTLILLMPGQTSA